MAEVGYVLDGEMLRAEYLALGSVGVRVAWVRGLSSAEYRLWRAMRDERGEPYLLTLAAEVTVLGVGHVWERRGC